jgi:hypothetical protein
MESAGAHADDKSRDAAVDSVPSQLGPRADGVVGLTRPFVPCVTHQAGVVRRVRDRVGHGAGLKLEIERRWLQIHEFGNSVNELKTFRFSSTRGRKVHR